MLSTAARRSHHVTVRLVLALLLAAAALVGAVSSSATAEPAPGEGILEVRSEPVVATQIRVGDIVRNTGSIAGLPLPAGTHRVCFSAPEGYLTPPCEEATVEEGLTTTVTTRFVVAGRLVVEVGPDDLGAEVLVDGILRDASAVTIPVGVGQHEVCFGEIAGYQAPPCEQVEVVAGEDALVRSAYEPVPTEPVEPAPVESDPIDPEPVDPEPTPDPVLEVTQVYSWTLGGKTMTREHPVTVEAGRLSARVDFSRADTVALALLDDGGRQLAAASGPSGTQIGHDVPAGSYRLTVTGSRAHYDLTVTANQGS